MQKIFIRKKKATEVINFGFSNPDEEKLILSKKVIIMIIMISKILLTRRKILLNILARLIEQYNVLYRIDVEKCP